MSIVYTFHQYYSMLIPICLCECYCVLCTTNCPKLTAPSGIHKVIWHCSELNMTFLGLIFPSKLYIYFLSVHKVDNFPRTTWEFISCITNQAIAVKCQVLMCVSHQQTNSSSL